MGVIEEVVWPGEREGTDAYIIACLWRSGIYPPASCPRACLIWPLRAAFHMASLISNALFHRHYPCAHHDPLPSICWNSFTALSH